MKKLALNLALLALVVVACGGPNSAPAATVDGNIISVGDVEAFMAPDQGTVDRPTFSQFLGAAIQLDIIFAAAKAEFGIDPSDEEVAATADQLVADNAINQTREEFLAQAGISELLLQMIARQQLVNDAVQTSLGKSIEPTEADVQDARRAAELGAAEVCAAHILVATEDEANDVLARLSDGEAFADLALELSLDTGSGANGGDLGCAAPGGYVREFAEAAMAAEIGVPTDPVESQFGFHIILVNDRTEADPADLPTNEELIAQLRPQLAATAFQNWFVEKIAAAVVQVEAEYGTWDPGPPPGVTPPPA